MERNDVCDYCGDPIPSGTKSVCTLKHVGDECLCCGRVLVAKSDDGDTILEPEG